MLIDVHFHADFLPEKKLEEIQRNEKIKLVVTNSVDVESCESNLKISKKFSKIKLAVGLYPEEKNNLTEYEKLENFVVKNKNQIFAIGEIGLDKTEKLDFEIQKKIFVAQLNLAKRLNLPVIVHTRKAEKEVLEILENYKELKIILHCFSGNFKLVKKAVELGCYFSIPTNIVRSEHFQKLVVEVPHGRILTETDAPYLSPFKEKQNESAFIVETIRTLSKIWNVPEKDVERQVETGFEKVFFKG